MLDSNLNPQNSMEYGLVPNWLLTRLDYAYKLDGNKVKMTKMKKTGLEDSPDIESQN